MGFARCLAAALLACATQAQAFCGFYVGKADAGLFNEASQVILVRDGHRTVISMLNDYKGELDEFALVVPVPEVLQRGQINVGDRRIFERIDGFSAPRLAEYHDDDPCARRELEMMSETDGARLHGARDQARRTRAPSASPWKRATRSANTTS